VQECALAGDHCRDLPAAGVMSVAAP
jgi:hypothetical protein